MFKLRLGKNIFFFGLLLFFSIMLLNLPRLSIPLLFSFVLYLIVSPILPYLVKVGLGKKISIFILMAVITTTAILPIVLVSPTIKSEAERVQYYIPKVERFLKNNYFKYKNVIKKKTGFKIGDKHLYDVLSYGKSITTKVLLGIPKMLASFLEWIFIVPLFFFFLLRDGRKMKSMFLSLVPNKIFERF